LDLNLGGLSDAVRSVLRAAGPHGLTPAEIRENLAQLHFPVNKYKNFSGSLHTVLRRLIEGKEVKRAIHDSTESGDESLYQWISKYGATNSLANTVLRERSKYDPDSSKWNPDSKKKR
jgi:hypothetical protein